MAREFTFDLHFHVVARDHEQALEIAESMRKTIEDHAEFRTCTKVEVDNIEEL